VAAIRASPKLALTIDTEGQPPHVLLVRGSARVEIVDGVADDFLDVETRAPDFVQRLAAEKGLGPPS
jgi:hypothetical protein